MRNLREPGGGERPPASPGLPAPDGRVRRIGRPTAGERLAAAASLGTLAGAAAALLAGVVRNWAAVTVALVGVVVAVTAGWYAVSRRGPARMSALVFVAGAVALLVAGLVIADLQALRIALTLALATVSVGCARVALRHTSHAPAIGGRAAPAAARARHPVLIMNPRSGGGKAERFRLPQACRARGIEPVELRPGDDLVRLAEDAIARGADAIGMAGGDGSQALVASVAARHGIPHVVVPAGTRNHFALDLGLDRDDVTGALDAFADPVERRVDLAEVNGRVFVNNASLGLYAKIVQSPEYRDAKLKTAAELLPVLLGPDAAPLDLRFTGPDGTAYPTAHMILVSNDPYQVDHIGGRGTRARMDVGALGVIVARIAGPAGARRFTALEAAGQVRRYSGWLEWQAPRFQISSGEPVDIGIDGEALAMEPPLVFSCRPGALRVWLPRHAPAVSPAAAAVHLTSRSAIAELIETAAGHAPPATLRLCERRLHVLEAVADHLPQLRRVLVPVLGYGVRGRRVEDLVLAAGDGERAVDLTGHLAAVDHLAGHFGLPPLFAAAGPAPVRTY